MESIRRRADDAACAAAEAARSPPVASTATSTIVASALSPAASSSSTPANSPPTHPTLPRARPRAALQDSGLLDALEADRAALRAVFGIPGWGEVSGQDEDFGSVFSPTPAVKPEVFLEREATDIPADVLVELLGAVETVVAPTGAEGTGGDAGAGAGFLTV